MISISSQLNFNLRSGDGYMTSSFNGRIIKWNKQCNIVKEIKPFSTHTVIKLVNDELVAIAQNGSLMIFDLQLKLVKKFTSSQQIPSCIGGNDKYIAHGSYGGCVRFYSRHDSNEAKVNKTRCLKLN